jgi:hypothetical protein
MLSDLGIVDYASIDRLGENGGRARSAVSAESDAPRTVGDYDALGRAEGRMLLVAFATVLTRIVAPDREGCGGELVR